jgi:hypothetical protein
MLLAALHGLCAFALAFPQTGEVALRQIILASEQEAIEMRARLMAGASFEAVAAERSRDATAGRGGYLGRMRHKESPNDDSNPLKIVDSLGILVDVLGLCQGEIQKCRNHPTSCRERLTF